MTPRDIERVKAKLIEDGDCVRWKNSAKTAAARRHPAIRLDDGRMWLVRRVLYEIEVGRIWSGYYLVPTCGDECCIKPEHQKQITKQQKNLRGCAAAASSPGRGAKISAGRRASGRVKLSMEIAREIRCSNETLPVLAARYGVDEKAIWDIRRGNTWKDYSNPFAGLL